MNDLALDPKLKVVAEVAQYLGRTERRIQQMIASGDLAARKATDLEELALRKAGRIRSSTERGVRVPVASRTIYFVNVHEPIQRGPGILLLSQNGV
jgi:hypothetical protein